jgi:hypothetical protein
MSDVLDLPARAPFRQYAMEYLQRGWLPLPLPPGEKSPPPVGFTGHYRSPTADDIEEWLTTEPERCNIGLRLPDGIIGIDVDAYGGKLGGATLGDLVTRWGPLPDTWTLSARCDGLSGIRFYRVPVGKSWPGEVGPDIQVIQYRHRYAVAFPSIHPKLKKKYQWYAPGSPIDGRSFSSEIPDISGLSMLNVSEEEAG